MRGSRKGRGSGPKPDERVAIGETKVLVVDDEPIDLRVCSTIVSSSGYEVLEAASCAEAQRQYRATRPHAAILDYQKLLP